MPITIARTTSASRPTDTRKTPDILSIVVTAYPLPEQRETSPGVVTVGRVIYPKVRGSPEFASNPNGSVATCGLHVVAEGKNVPVGILEPRHLISGGRGPNS
jgi:hypothetical protein